MVWNNGADFFLFENLCVIIDSPNLVPFEGATFERIEPPFAKKVQDRIYRIQKFYFLDFCKRDCGRDTLHHNICSICNIEPVFPFLGIKVKLFPACGRYHAGFGNCFSLLHPLPNLNLKSLANKEL